MKDLTGTCEIVPEGKLKRSLIIAARRFLMDRGQLGTKTTHRYIIEPLWSDSYSNIGEVSVTDRSNDQKYTVGYEWNYKYMGIRYGGFEVYMKVKR